MKLTKQQLEINRSGPISNEMFRLAVIELRKNYGDKWDLLSPKAQRNHCIALLWNSGDIFLKQARFNVEGRS